MTQQDIHVLRLSQVISRTGLPRSSIYYLMSIGQFPRPISLMGRRVAWLASDIDAWLRERIAERKDAIRVAAG